MTAEDGSAHAGTDPAPVGPASPREPVSGAADEATHGVDDVLGREVALVTLRPVSGEALHRRVDRVRRLARLHHPHLVEVYDVDGLDDDAEHVLVLESVRGRPLDELAAAAPLPLGQVAEVGARVASALAQAHRHGVVHGRLGPASILVEDDRRVWLVGLTATLQDDADAPRPGAGAPHTADTADTGTDAVDGGDAPAPADEPTRADDLRALAATLASVVAPAGAVELGRVLGEARHGGGSADELSGRLLRLARRDAAPTDGTGAVYAPGAAAAGAGGMRRLTARALAGAGTVAAGAATSGAAAGSSRAYPTAAAGAGAASGPTSGAGGPSGRPARGLVGGARLATLAAVALLLALTSGVVIWGQETRGWFGAAQSEPEAAAPAPVPAPAAPPLPVTVPGTRSGSEGSGGSRPRSSDASDSSDSSGAAESDRSSRSGSAEGSGRAPAPAPVPPAPAPPVVPPTTVPPTTPPSTTRPTTRPTTPPSTTPPSTTGSPSTDPSPSRETPAPGSTDGADGAGGADGQQGAAPSATPRTRTAEQDAGAQA